MHRPSFRVARLFALALLFASLAPAVPASAQRALQQVLDLNRQAMDAYNNLEIEQASSLLQQALEAATRGHVTGSPLARTYVNLGIVAIAGLGDNGGGLNYFVQAIQADANVSLDPLLSTPDISLIWTQARARAGTGGTTTTVVTPPPPEPTGAVGDLAHAPVPEQLRSTPVPVYLEVPGRPAHVYIYYRGHGMREFQRAEMESMGRGYGYEIPCEDVFEPEVAYYIVAFDSSGSPNGFAGSQSSPITVPIVATRTTSEPALPGRAPPTQCTSMEEECPPGMPCASAGSAGLGDSCSRDADCASNNCDDDLCAIGSGIRDGDEGPAPDASQESPRFFARLGGYAGVSQVDNGLPTDRTPCPESTLNGMDDVGQPVDCDFVSNPQVIPDDPAGAAGNQYTLAGVRNFGYQPAEFGSDTDPCDLANGGQCTFYVDSPGAVVGFALRLDVGYYIIPRWFAVALNVRVQPVSGNGALSFMQLGLRVETQLTDPSPVGFHAHVHLGFIAYGQIQVFLGRSSSPTLDRNAAAPWGQSGQQGFEFGGTIGYRFMPNFGLYLQPSFIFNFPTFLFTADLGGGIEVGF
jgi:hypothetical protein